MSETLEIPEIVPEEEAQHAQEQYDKELYKKWFKAGGQAGFLSITPFRRNGRFVGRFIVDVGKVDPNNNSPISSTKCYIDAIQLAVYLRSVFSGNADTLFPKRGGTNSDESFLAYGGSPGDNPIARVFKIEHWGATRDNPGNGNGFAWKCGHFKGNVTPTGAITADMSEPLSTDMIKVTRIEMAEIYERVNLAMIGFASQDPTWYE